MCGLPRDELVYAIEALAELVENRRPLAENRVDLDEVLVRGNEASDAVSGESEFRQAARVLIEAEQAVGRVAGGAAVDA